MIARRREALPVVAAVGVVACGIGVLIDPKAMVASYLAAWVAVSAVPIGALGVLLVTYLVRGDWTDDMHAPLSGAALALPVAGVLFLPVAAGMGLIYPWASGTAVLSTFKAAYLTPWFFLLRTVLYFAIWSVIARRAVRAYGDDAGMTRAASAGLVVWTLTVSLAGIDWIESVEADFHSSIYGLLTVAFALVAGFAFALVVMLARDIHQRMETGSYGAILLALLMLWAYLHAMQYIIVWAGNIPDEVSWYLVRLDDGWRVVLWVLFAGQFIVPFLALLSARLRGSRSALLVIAAGTLGFRVVEAIVLLLPPLGLSAPALAFDLPAAVVAIGACWLAAVPWRRSGRAATAG